MPFTALPVPQRPPATVPVVDTATGRISQAWATYFDALAEYLKQFAASV
jgi:hypothetical protein